MALPQTAVLCVSGIQDLSMIMGVASFSWYDMMDQQGQCDPDRIIITANSPGCVQSYVRYLGRHDAGSLSSARAAAYWN